MKTLKLIVKILIGISSLIYFLFAIMGFIISSWQTGIFWLIGALLLVLLFLSLTKVIFPKLPTAGKIVLAIVPFFLFVIGSFLIPSSAIREYDKSMDKSEQKDFIKNEDVQKQVDTLELKAFQKNWTDSIVKDWKGSYVSKGSVSSNADTIYFELTSTATKGNWKSTSDLHQSIYQKAYDSLINSKYGNLYNDIKTSIVFVPNSEQELANQAITERKNKIQRQLSSWDGSHTNLKRLVKDNMNDPKSFEHVETTYKDKGDYILVQMKYRGKNAFGAKVLDMVTAKVDIDGNILSISNK